MATILPFGRKSPLIELEPSLILEADDDDADKSLKNNDPDDQNVLLARRSEDENRMLARLYISHAALLLSEPRNSEAASKYQKIRWVLEDCARLLNDD